MSTSGGGGGLTPLTSLEAGVEAPFAAILHLPVTDVVSGRPEDLPEDAATSENLSAFLFLIDVVCLFGVSEHCALETVRLIWHDPRG